MDSEGQHPVERLHPRSLVNLRRQLQSLVEGRLWLKVLIGMMLGIGTGILLGPSAGLIDPEIARTTGNWLALPGQYVSRPDPNDRHSVGFLARSFEDWLRE